MGGRPGRDLDGRRRGVNAAVRRFSEAMPDGGARWSFLFVLAAVAIFTITVVGVPPFPVTFDEAKYLGIGYSMVEGQGPRIVFGSYFLPHAPVWPTVVVAPAIALGIDALTVGRALNALSGVGLIVLTAALAWRVRPAAAALAAIALLGTTFFHELTRTARLDVPSAALAIAFLALGLVAVRRGSAPLAVAAGLLFGVAFLVKEIALPLAPVPILAAILHRQPWRPILRTAGWLILSGTVVVAPWFIFVADVSDRVYRLGTPGWTLLPIGVALLAVGVVAVIAGRGEDDRPAFGLADRLEGRRRTWLVVGMTLAWTLALTLVFTGVLRTRTTGLVDLAQIARYIELWWAFHLTAAIGAVGLVLSILAWPHLDKGRREAAEDLWLATICGLPLVILVVGVGEGPRNYLAQLAIGAAIAAVGWLWLFDVAVRRWTTVTILAVGALFGPVVGLVIGEFVGVRFRVGAAAGLVGGVLVAGAIGATLRAGRLGDGSGRVPPERAVAALLAVGLVSASALLALAMHLRQPTPTRDEAVATVAAWAKENVEPGSTVAFGSYLGYEMALPLRKDFRIRQVRHVLVVGDVEAPDGVRVFGKPAVDDWVSMDIAPKNIHEFQAFSASLFIAQLRRSEAAYWVYSTGTSTAADTIIPALEGAVGFEQLAHWSFPRRTGDPIDTYAYRLDLDRLAIDPARIHMAPDALERMVNLVESTGATDLARRLAPQVEAVPASPETDALIARLRQVAGT